MEGTRICEPLGARAPGPLPALVAAMLRPDFYPHCPRTVELVQTHISWVFLAGEYVYKVKKPARFAFVDASTLEARCLLCLEEVRLNQRLAPEVYLGVAAIVSSDGGFALRGLTGEPPTGVVEYAVAMHRLPGERMLDRLVSEGAVSTGAIEAIARRLGQFYRDACRKGAPRYGCAAAVAQMVMGNLAECERFEGYTLNRAQMSGLIRYTRGFLDQNWQLLNKREHQGRVIEGHGDLRCEHICLAGEKIVIFDCVEFSERLRYADAACDVAFLAMDLERLGAPHLAARLCTSYAELTDDPDFTRVLPFYKPYRAAVRAKVESLRSLDSQVPRAEREQARALAARYFAMACRYAACYDGRPAVVVVCGAAGTGKSTIARILGKRLGFEVLNSDEVRKRMIGASPTTAQKAPYGSGIYSQEFTQRTYDALILGARQRLEAGAGVILDATFRHPGERRHVLEIAARTRATVLFVECRADEAEVMRRLSERSRRPGSVSDADAAVHLRQLADFVPLDEIAVEYRIVADTTRGNDATVIAAERRLGTLCAPNPPDEAIADDEQNSRRRQL